MRTTNTYYTSVVGRPSSNLKKQSQFHNSKTDGFHNLKSSMITYNN